MLMLMLMMRRQVDKIGHDHDSLDGTIGDLSLSLSLSLSRSQGKQTRVNDNVRLM
jgi:hypothetical protein